MTDNNDRSRASSFCRAATGHANAADIVNKFLQNRDIEREDSTWVALHNLIGLAAESAFKAYLLSCGVKYSELRKHNVGHNLTALHQKCIVAGLKCEMVRVANNELSDLLGQLATVLATDHEDYNYRYIEGETLFLLHRGQPIDLAIAAIRALTDIAQAQTPDLH